MRVYSLESQIESKARVQIVCGTLGLAAIEDYIVARWAILNGLTRQFYWSASQAIEKFGKTALALQNKRIPRNHSIENLIDRLIKSEPESPLLGSFKTLPNSRFPNELSAKDIISFVAQIQKFGSPNSRYFEKTYISYPSDIHRLDETVIRLYETIFRLAIPEYSEPLASHFRLDLSSTHFSDEAKRHLTLNNLMIDKNAEPARQVARMAKSPRQEPMVIFGNHAKALEWLNSLQADERKH